MRKQDESKWFIILLNTGSDLKDPISFPWMSAKLTEDEADFYFRTIIPSFNMFLNSLESFDIPPNLISVSQKDEWTTMSLNFTFDRNSKNWSEKIIPEEVYNAFEKHAKNIRYFEKLKEWIWKSWDKLERTDSKPREYIPPGTIVHFYFGKKNVDVRSKVKISVERLSHRSKHRYEIRKQKEKFEKDWKEKYEPAFRKKLEKN